MNHIEPSNIRVTDHAIKRAVQRILSPQESAQPRLDLHLHALWLAGRLDHWHDPDDGPGETTITSETNGWRGLRYLVGRLDAIGALAIVTALSRVQWRRSVEYRWMEAHT